MDGAVGGCKKVVMGDFSKSTFDILELAVHYCDTQTSKRRRSEEYRLGGFLSIGKTLG